METSTQSVITQRLLFPFVLAACACSTAPEIRWRGFLQNGFTRGKWTRGIGNSIGVGRVFGECRARSLTPRGPAGTRRPAQRPPPRLGGRANGVFRRRLVSVGTDPTPWWDGRARRTSPRGAGCRGAAQAAQWIAAGRRVGNRAGRSPDTRPRPIEFPILTMGIRSTSLGRQTCDRATCVVVSNSWYLCPTRVITSP